jgi:hypothetical protein
VLIVLVIKLQVAVMGDANNLRSSKLYGALKSQQPRKVLISI